MDSREDIEKELNNFFENLLNGPTEDKTEAIKKYGTLDPTQFRPISLCNVVQGHNQSDNQ